MKLDPEKHFINKSKTKHYYLNHTFTNDEWKDYINDKTVQNDLRIGVSSKYRKTPKQCDRWYNQDNNSKNIVKHCPNKPFYRSSNGIYLCKYCSKEVNRLNPDSTFTKIT
jgi:ribosomal protein L37AE/L43A